jgi:cytochrome c biogenesis protein CcmG, thiol:disulfide interchange protein DsbE
MTETGPDDRRPRRRFWFRVLQAGALAVVASLIALLGWRAVGVNRGRSLVAAIRADKRPPAPDFRLPVIWDRSRTWPRAAQSAIGDAVLSPAELRGYPVVLNFWASWCIPCKDEAPLLAASATAHRGRVAFLGVDVQDFESDASRFLKRYEVNYPSVRDGGDSTYSAYGLTGLPETYYLDPSGRIVEHSPGQLSAEDLEDGITQAMGQGDEAPDRGRSRPRARRLRGRRFRSGISRQPAAARPRAAELSNSRATRVRP